MRRVPDVALVDCSIRRMNGLEAAQRIRQNLTAQKVQIPSADFCASSLGSRLMKRPKYRCAGQIYSNGLDVSDATTAPS